MRTQMFRNLIRHGLIAAAATTFVACSTTTYESYRPVENRKVDIAYVAASADFSKYKRLMADEMGIYFPTHASPSEQDIARVREAFRFAFLAELGGYEIVDKPAADVMLVRASLVDLRGTAADNLPQLSSDINEILKPYKLTFIIEMLDSVSGNALVRAADTEKAPIIDLAEDGSADASELEAAAAYWAGLFRSFLDQNIRGVG